MPHTLKRKSEKGNSFSKLEPMGSWLSHFLSGPGEALLVMHDLQREAKPESCTLLGFIGISKGGEFTS